VQIASYRDPDCQHTVEDLFTKATHQGRVFVGICWQFVAAEDAICFKVPCPFPAQLRVLEVPAGESRGVCWARSQTQALWRGEEFTLQIDSHMRFEPGWDELLLGMWRDCENPRAVLTCYPPGFTPPDTLDRDWIYGMAAKEFDVHRILLAASRPSFALDRLPERPVPGALASACAFFAPASIIADVPYDPHLYFFGEEISLAVRAWTHGYDIFHPNRLFVFHDWDRSKRPTHFSDHRDWGKANDRAFARVRHLLGTERSEDPEVLAEIGHYGLGTARSLADYQRYSGIDFAHCRLEAHALAGEFAAPTRRAVSGRITRPATRRQRVQVKAETLNMSPPSDHAGTPIETLGAHRARLVYASRSAIVIDDFLPEETYQQVHDWALKTDYEYINTKGKVTRAWHIHDGFPLRSTLNVFYHAEGSSKPVADYVYPTRTALDGFVEHMLATQRHVAHLTGTEGRTGWGHFSTTGWLYPHGTSLHLHDDGSGVYTGAYVYFLNPMWRVHWGGMLLLFEDAANSIVHAHRATTDQMEFYQRKWLMANQLDELLMAHGFARCILPKKNRIVFIANDAYHTVTRVNETSGDNVRMSLAGFFHRFKD
jgi:hypothetical protein